MWSGKADQTTGGLTKRDLCLNASGRVVSRKRSEYARKMFDENEGLRQKFKDGAAPPINKPKAPNNKGRRPIQILEESEAESQSESELEIENPRTKVDNKSSGRKGPSGVAVKKASLFHC